MNCVSTSHSGHGILGAVGCDHSRDSRVATVNELGSSHCNQGQDKEYLQIIITKECVLTNPPALVLFVGKTIDLRETFWRLGWINKVGEKMKY